MDNYNIIVSAEEQFAREVTLGVIVTRPLTVWHYIIPGMFVIDFLRRGSAIRQYTKHFMFPRKVALDTALAVTREEDKDSWNTRMREDIGAWLESLNLYSSELLLAHVALVELLSEHYLKLLQANGDTINLLIEDAYRQRDHFKQFVETITAAENEVDRQVMEKLAGNEKVQEKIIAEQQQIAKRRRKIMDEIF
ncbi:MAG: NF038143 family protein [Desulfobacterales bacterium]|jgi:hypothetical protein